MDSAASESSLRNNIQSPSVPIHLFHSPDRNDSVSGHLPSPTVGRIRSIMPFRKLVELDPDASVDIDSAKHIFGQPMSPVQTRASRIRFQEFGRQYSPQHQRSGGNEENTSLIVPSMSSTELFNHRHEKLFNKMRPINKESQNTISRIAVPSHKRSASVLQLRNPATGDGVTRPSKKIKTAATFVGNLTQTALTGESFEKRAVRSLKDTGLLDNVPYEQHRSVVHVPPHTQISTQESTQTLKAAHARKHKELAKIRRRSSGVSRSTLRTPRQGVLSRLLSRKKPPIIDQPDTNTLRRSSQQSTRPLPRFAQMTASSVAKRKGPTDD